MQAQRKEEMENKKKAALKAQKIKRKQGETLEARMGAVVKPPKDSAKLTEKQVKNRKEMTSYVRSELLEQLIEKAVAVGESLVMSRDIQTKFQQRPVTKFIYPMKMEFQYNVVGVQPKTVQMLDKLGQIMFLDSDNQLNQYDICTNKMLQTCNLGTRPPLKHYDIIDLVCDQSSFRIYTLNKNWILEIWMVEQATSLPLKRIAVCTNDQNKDYISMYYKKTFNNSKPRFLSL